ncbi:hypothetical protein CB1_000622005 [Camelus ferus]|nr:hypothetical protein CB1_000622005 [Camelus ferus]
MSGFAAGRSGLSKRSSLPPAAAKSVSKPPRLNQRTASAAEPRTRWRSGVRDRDGALHHGSCSVTCTCRAALVPLKMILKHLVNILIEGGTWYSQALPWPPKAHSTGVCVLTEKNISVELEVNRCFRTVAASKRNVAFGLDHCRV